MKSTSYLFELLLTIFLLLDYDINVAEEKMVKPQTKLFCAVRFELVWAKMQCGLSRKNVKQYICDLSWITSQTTPTQIANTPSHTW